MGAGDRTTGLILFGVLEILIGVVWALHIPLTLVAAALSSSVDSAAQTLTANRLVPGLSLFAVAAVAFIWLGVGSVRARRWAQALWLVTAWVWLAFGVTGLALTVALLPGLRASMALASGLPDSWVTGVVGGVVAATAGVNVLLPAVLIVFYRDPEVRATCERRNPRPAWTDACPPGLLSLCLVYVFGAYCLLLMPFYGSVVPVFGAMVDGTAGLLLLLALTVLTVVLAAATYRRDPRAWWAGIVAATAACLSTAVTFLRWPVAAVVERMGLTGDEAAIILSSPLAGRGAALLLTGLSWLSFVVYLVAVRRQFSGEGTGA